MIDVRNFGLVGAVEFSTLDGRVGARAYGVFLKCLELGILVRAAGDVIALSPPLIISEAQIDQLMDVLGTAIKTA